MLDSKKIVNVKFQIQNTTAQVLFKETLLQHILCLTNTEVTELHQCAPQSMFHTSQPKNIIDVERSNVIFDVIDF